MSRFQSLSSKASPAPSCVIQHQGLRVHQVWVAGLYQKGLPLGSKGACSCLAPHLFQAARPSTTLRPTSVSRHWPRQLGSAGVVYFGLLFFLFLVALWPVHGTLFDGLSGSGTFLPGLGQRYPVKKNKNTPCKPFCNIPFCHSVILPLCQRGGLGTQSLPKRSLRKDPSPKQMH